MGFDVERFKDQPDVFLAEHSRAIREIEAGGLKCTRFIDRERSAVLYVLRIDGVLKNLDELEGLLFVESIPISFKASRYGGHAANKIEITSVEVPTGLKIKQTEVVGLLAEGLETYRLWFAGAFWEEWSC